MHCIRLDALEAQIVYITSVDIVTIEDIDLITITNEL